jgi:protein gp37
VSKIENNIGWCDATTNVVTGCAKVSEGCKLCYAERSTRARVLRHGGFETWGPSGVRVAVKSFGSDVASWNRKVVCDACHEAHNTQSYQAGRRCTVHGCRGLLRNIRVFADSTSDWLDEKWNVGQRGDLLRAVLLARNLRVILLTKRIQNFERMLRECLDHHKVAPSVNDEW